MSAITSNLKDLQSNSTIRNQLDLTSTSLIQFVNTLDIKYLIQCMETVTELDSKVSISWVADQLSSAMIRTWGSTDLDSIVHSAKFKDLNSASYIPYSQDLNSKTIVTDLNIMDIIFKLIQAPVLTLTCNALQDSYIRESRPTLNYGVAQSLLIGDPIEGRYLSLLQLDIRPYNNIHVSNKISVLTSELILSLTGTFDSTTIIDIFECTAIWNETTVTWSNFSQSLSTLITSFTCPKSKVNIDLTNYINQRQLQGANNLNLVLVARDHNSGQIITIESTNSTDVAKRPHLEIRYQDNSWIGTTASTDLNGSSTIRATNSRDILSNVNIRRKEITDLDAMVIKQRTAVKDVISSTIVRHTDYTDLSSQSQLLPNKDLDSVSVTRHTDLKDVLSSSNIYVKDDLDGFVDIKSFHSWLVGQAIIRGYSTKDLDSSATIRHNIDLSSNSINRLSKFMELSGKGIIRLTNTTDLTSQANIRQYIDLMSNTIICKTVDKDLTSSGKSRLSTETDLNASIQVRGSYDDLMSTSITRTKGYKELSSYVYSAFGSSIDGTATIKSLIKTATIDLTSTTNVRRTTTNDLTSVAELHHTINLLSSAIVRQLASKDLISKSVIHSTTDLISTALMYQIKDLVSSVTVPYRTKSDLSSYAFAKQISDLISTAGLYQIKDMQSSAIVRHTAIRDIISTAIIQQYDITELDSVAYLFGLEVWDINCSVMVQRMGKDYLDSKAEIQTTARQWIPNLHGVEKFNYEDRKLPRKWIRSNFI